MKVNYINILERKIEAVELQFAHGSITSLTCIGGEDKQLPYVLPGFVDAHVHIESSMLTPSQFARLAVVHGTVATVSDPHEIANVLGMQGVEYMISEGKRSPFKFCFGAPSCVPATIFETAGAVLDAEDIASLLSKEEVGYLAEVMNFPGVLNGEQDLLKKLEWAKKFGKPIDGHAPGLRGADAKAYIDAGISTDHECFTYEEASEKIKYGAKILIREGSAARNFEALVPLFKHHPADLMFCSDDKHPDNLEEGHINLLVKRALLLGYNLWDVLKAACINPVHHYNLPVGLLYPQQPADFIVIDNLSDFNILETYLDGALVAKDGKSLLPDLRSEHPNLFNCLPTKPDDFIIKAKNLPVPVRVIDALEGQLITNSSLASLPLTERGYQSDPKQDVLKITVINRYENAKPAVGFIRNFGLSKGAMASSVGHDSHNILAVGCDDMSISKAVNLIIENKGGLAAVGPDREMILPLPIAGLMTDRDGYQVAKDYTKLDQYVKDELHSTLKSPFMTLSFMALLVIPALKLSDKGLFDGNKFEFVALE